MIDLLTEEKKSISTSRVTTATAMIIFDLWFKSGVWYLTWGFVFPSSSTQSWQISTFSQVLLGLFVVVFYGKSSNVFWLFKSKSNTEVTQEGVLKPPYFIVPQ